CAGEDVEATVIGRFEPTGKLRLRYNGEAVGELDMHFLHEGRPLVVRQATWRASPVASAPGGEAQRESASPRPALTRPGSPELTRPGEPGNLTDVLLRLLSSLNVASKEWIIRQYDHEVQ